MPDWEGASGSSPRRAGSGSLDPAPGRRDLRLGGEVANSLAVDDAGACTSSPTRPPQAPGRLRPGELGRRGGRRTTGAASRSPASSSQGSGTTPTVLPGGLVAITDNAEPRMHVLVLRGPRTDRWCARCRCSRTARARPTTPSSRWATRSSWRTTTATTSPLSTTLGRDHDAGRRAGRRRPGDGCSVAWTSDEVAPSSVPKVSLANGLLYVYTTRSSAWGSTRGTSPRSTYDRRNGVLGADRDRNPEQQPLRRGDAGPRRVRLHRHAGRNGEGPGRVTTRSPWREPRPVRVRL